MSASTVRYPALRLRRWGFLAAVLLTSAAGTGMMVRIVGAAGFTLLEALILALFIPTFAWIVLPFWTAVAGFVLALLDRDPLTLARRAPAADTPGGVAGSPPGEGGLRSRTALVVPIYNEDPTAVAARLSAMARALEATGQGGRFHFHILSDTRHPEIARAEEAAWARLQGTHPASVFFYRRRPENRGRKAGNIAEFCRRCGDDYDFMVVLDADSVMAGETLVRLVRTMEANPRVGLIQTVPLPVRQETLLARSIQFAAALYAPLLAAGQAFWQGDAANYWGHNAILRVAPFRDHADLPVLPGGAPWGGEILSHDFVEAALLRRAGWEVVLDSGAGGSWEELPGNLEDYARRDRRWAQGSIQHLRLLGLPGLHPLSRAHFLTGAMGYLSSPLWLLLLLAGTAYVFFPGLRAHAVLAGAGLPPVPLSLLAGTAGILFLPKVMGVALALRQAGRFGGAGRLLAGAVVEAVLSVLLAPVMMVYHTRFVVEIASGRAVGWDAQPREGGVLPWRLALGASAAPF
ncbi:MAG TPA: glucans biosynthesis glucosyltransferase MdoH, partial [Longimicrobiales bacterium]|nr:glucans biosynthesis glucosyltransferase MdoH [Longimicrobiales bacterium]